MSLLSPKGSSPLSLALWKRHRRGWALVLLFLMAAGVAVTENGRYLQLSVLTKPEHAAFDGTVYPLAQVPNWLVLSAGEDDLPYADFSVDQLMALPSYNPSRLKIDYDALQWSEPYDDYTRQMKLTYPVPYAGNYKLDGVEGAGSHPAVDIKAPQGTPVIAVMNGVVEKVSYSDSGFGHLIVLKHNGVPAPDDAEVTTTLYSGYSHLDSILVTEGEVVSKGEVIGTVGMTGTATTHHLHFQIDNSAAPWHLYWPFTSAEANAVGGFFEAVNQGVGQSNVYAYTVNPLEYVEQHLDPLDLPVEKIEMEVASEEVAEFEEEENTAASSDLPFASIVVDAPSYVLPGSATEALVSLQDERGELLRVPYFNTPIQVTVTDPFVLEVFPTEFTKTNFATGEALLNLYGLAESTTTVTLSFSDQLSTAFEVVVTRTLASVASFDIELDSTLSVGEATQVAIVALDEQGQRVPQVDFEGSLRLEILQGSGDFSRDTLVASDFESGIATVFFTPSAFTEVLLKVSNESLSGLSTVVSPTLFSDLSEESLYYQAIETLRRLDVIAGYPDGSFRPDQPVSRVEALKLIFEGLNKEVVSGISLNFPDAFSTEWYGPYVAAAERDGIIKGYPDGTLRPASEVNRVEFIKLLAEAMQIDVDPVVVGNPYDDVHYLEWYAPYAQFVKLTNIAPWTDSMLNPSLPMTRAEVAEMIYRVLAIKQNEADAYSRTLVVE